MGDLARGYTWPKPFTIRTLQNGIIQEWLGRKEELQQDSALREKLAKQYSAAAASGDPDNAGIVVGESVGLISDRPSARVLVKRILDETIQELLRAPTLVI